MHGNSDQLGGKNANQYVTNDKFAILSGEITLANTGGSTNVNYPSGYNKDNCVVVSCGITYTSQGWRAFGTVQAAISTGTRLNQNNITVCCYPIQGGTSGPSGTFDYKLVLMKVV